MVCPVCGGMGKDTPDGKGCPRCGLTLRKTVDLNIGSTIMDSSIIPVYYQGQMWKKPTQDNLPLETRKFDESLEKVLDVFLKGKLPTFSMFAGAPPKSGKNLWAYSCMQVALSYRFSVAPFLSTADWYRLDKTSKERPWYKLYNLYTWDNLIQSDVVFIYVEYDDDRYSVIPLLKTVLDARAAFNLSTMIISDYQLTTLVPAWKSRLYSVIHNADPTCNRLRYPVIIHRQSDDT